MNSAPVPHVFDPIRHARRRSRAAAQYHEYDFLKRRLSRDLAERLADSSRQFPVALDHGCHNGVLGEALLESGQVSSVIATDPAEPMARRARARGLAACVMPLETLAFAPGSLDLAASALSLHWVNDLPGLLVQLREALKPDGLFLAAIAGAGTLPELRESLALAETEIRGGAGPRISPLPGLQDLAALMQRAGFAMPVVDIETITVRYDNAMSLLQDLRGMGETAAFGQPADQGLSRRILMRAAETYQASHSDPDGRVRATFRIVWLSGWAPAQGQPKPLKPGSAKVSLTEVFARKGDTTD